MSIYPQSHPHTAMAQLALGDPAANPGRITERSESVPQPVEPLVFDSGCSTNIPEIATEVVGRYRFVMM